MPLVDKDAVEGGEDLSAMAALFEDDEAVCRILQDAKTKPCRPTQLWGSRAA